MNNHLNKQHVILNFDHSAGIPDGALNIELDQWQEMIRFGCKWKQFSQLENYLSSKLPAQENLGCVLMGSGDYHHITQLLLKRMNHHEPFHLIVCDNHPDNMRYPFGIHCGSWVNWASKLPQVARIDVLGISSSDISLAHAWENHWRPLRKNKVHYWSIQQDAHWMKWIGAAKAWHGYQNPDELMDDFLHEMSQINLPIYLSIDKDVLSKEVVMTNWDQGHFLAEHLLNLIEQCKGQLIGADITGDVSAYHYLNHFKRFLSASDGQNEPTQAEIDAWQINQKDLNMKLIDALDMVWK